MEYSIQIPQNIHFFTAHGPFSMIDHIHAEDTHRRKDNLYNNWYLENCISTCSRMVGLCLLEI